MPGDDGAFIHATAIAIGEAGLLIQGASGSGKSALALALLARAEELSFFGRLIGDDRIHIAKNGQRIILRPHPAIMGKIERRGRGILTLPFLAAAVARCVISIEKGALVRLPEEAMGETMLRGISLPLLSLGPDLPPHERAANLWMDLCQLGFLRLESAAASSSRLPAH